MSFDGRYVAYNLEHDIFVRDRDKNSTGVFDQVYQDIKVTVTTDNNPIDGFSYGPSISANGRYVAFTSHATNLVPVDTNGVGDIFVYDTANMELKRISAPQTSWEQSNKDSWYPSISTDGSCVVFTSDATNLIATDTNNRTDVFTVSLDLDSPIDTIPPTAPAGLHSANSGPNWLNLAWNPATDNTIVGQYSVYRGTDSSGPFTKVGTVNGNVYSYWDTTLTPSTSYYYYVQAQDEDGNLSAVPTPVQLNTPAILTTSPTAVSVAAGSEYSVARLNDGSAWALDLG
jgi:hypothetical protein